MPLDLSLLPPTLASRIHYLPTVTSTMDVASRLAAAGAPPNTVVLAEQQTAGRGRQGRSWHSEPEAGLYLSVLLDAPLPAPELPLFTLTAGLAAAEAIARAANLACDLRWPNDLLLEDRKCAGILIHFEPPTLIAGIGINVNHLHFPPELAPFATSLRLASGHPHSREALLAELLPALNRYHAMLARGGKQAILDLFSRRSSYVSGRPVSVQLDGRMIKGVTAGLDHSGFLLLRLPDGSLTTILAGGVRPASHSFSQEDPLHASGA